MSISYEWAEVVSRRTTLAVFRSARRVYVRNGNRMVICASCRDVLARAGERFGYKACFMCGAYVHANCIRWVALTDAVYLQPAPAIACSTCFTERQE